MLVHWTYLLVLSSLSIIYAYIHIHYPLLFMVSVFDLCLFASDWCLHRGPWNRTQHKTTTRKPRRLPQCQHEDNVKYEEKIWYTHIQNHLYANKRQNVIFFHFLRRILFNIVTMRKVNTKCRNMPRLSINSNSRFKNLYTPRYTTRPLINMTRIINSYLKSFWKSLFTTLSEKLPSRFTSKPTSTQPQAQKQLPSSDHFVQQPWVPTNSNYRSKFLQILNSYSARNLIL